MVVRQRRGSIFSCFFILFMIFHTSAGETHVPIANKFGQRGLFKTHSAKVLGFGRLTVGGYSNLTIDDSYLIGVSDSAELTTSKDWKEYTAAPLISETYINIGYGITRFLDLSIAAPFYFEWVNKKPSKGDFGQNVLGWGDLEVSLKFQYPPYPHRRFFEMAYFGGLSLPTGSTQNGYFPRRSYYIEREKKYNELLKNDGTIDKDKAKNNGKDITGTFTSQGVEFDMLMLWTFDFDKLRNGAPVEAHVNYGVRWTPRNLNHLFKLNIGLQYTPVSWFTASTEFTSATRLSNVDNGFSIGDDPLWLTPGIHFSTPIGIYISGKVDIAVSSDSAQVQYKTSYPGKNGQTNAYITTKIQPRYRVGGSLGWTGWILPQDKDKDGFKDKEDRCPNDPEDFDGFEDGDGCPEVDNDNDGLADSLDKCPNEAEDMDQFEDEDGCPDYDNDNDGIRDIADQCMNEPEDIDGFKDDDGCPELDNDLDQIVDSVDQCPNQPEDMDNFQDEDGCPDFDNDNDGIPDSLDQCPNEPELFNDLKDDDGCPDEKPKEIKRGRVILRGVNFETGSDKLTVDSYAILNQVVASLKEWPEIVVEIIGHTDSKGSRRYNKNLSQKRAFSVRNYLVAQGIEPSRLKPIGRGEEQPIESNATAEGRAQNRRVELRRID